MTSTLTTADVAVASMKALEDLDLAGCYATTHPAPSTAKPPPNRRPAASPDQQASTPPANGCTTSPRISPGTSTR